MYAPRPDPAVRRIRSARRIASSIDYCVTIKAKEIVMAKGEQKGNREQKKPKKEKIKVIAAAPSQKTAGWQPSFGSGKKK